VLKNGNFCANVTLTKKSFALSKHGQTTMELRQPPWKQPFHFATQDRQTKLHIAVTHLIDPFRIQI
jgi:hypothetical protein